MEPDLGGSWQRSLIRKSLPYPLDALCGVEIEPGYLFGAKDQHWG